jgi:hypothetical protein
MTKTSLLLVLALLVTTLPRAEAAALRCSDPIPDGACSDRELRGLDRAVDAEFDAIIEHAEPLTKLLLRRDQAWFVEIVTRGFTRKYDGPRDPQRLRLIDTLV